MSLRFFLSLIKVLITSEKRRRIKLLLLIKKKNVSIQGGVGRHAFTGSMPPTNLKFLYA
jgi:hypothetical protein